LKLSGLVKRDGNGNLAVRNPIYRRLFDNVWVQRTRPKRALNRARNYAIAASIAFVLLLAGGATYYVNVVRPAQIRLQALDRLAELKISITDAKDGPKAVFPDGATPELIRSAIPLMKTIRVAEIDSALDPDRYERDKNGFVGEIDDLSLFSGLSELRWLDLRGLKISRLGSLEGLEQLEALIIAPNASRPSSERIPLANIAAIERLKKLRRLSLANTMVSDLEPLANLQELEVVNVSFTDVANLQPLKELQKLEQLQLSSTPTQSLTALSELRSLKRLSFSQTQISDLSPLRNLTRLQVLSFSETKIADVSALADKTELYQINLGSTNVATIAPLSTLANLSVLWLPDTPVKDVSPLAGLRHLEILNLRNTGVTDVTPLMGATSLKILVVWGTKIPKEQLELLRDRSKVYIYSDDSSTNR
jgi:Leucine-rich repeat (LRR) protein